MEWIGISNEVKDLIKKCLTKSDKRLKAYEVLAHKWMKIGLEKKNCVKEINLQPIELFAKFHKFKKSVLISIASQLSEQEIGDLKNLFFEMDSDEDGVISFEDFQNFVLISHKNKTEQELKFLFDALDMGKTGFIDYNGKISIFIFEVY